MACANVVEMVGCRLILADIEKDTKLLSISDTLKKLQKEQNLLCRFTCMVIYLMSLN